MEWIGDHLWAVWMGVMMVLGIAEMASMDLVLIMLAVGAGGGMLAALIGLGLPLQLLVAALGSVAMLAVVRPSVARRLHTGPELSLGHGKLVGRQAEVTQELSGQHVGRVSISGEEWSASPYDESLTITVGQTVEIFEIRGATAYVHPLPELEQ